MPIGGPNEGFASNYGYGGMPGTTTGMAQGGYANTGNPQIGAKERYQQGALNATGQGNNVNVGWTPGKPAAVTSAKPKTKATSKWGHVYPTTTPTQTTTPTTTPYEKPVYSGYNPNDWGSPGYGNYDPGWDNSVQQPTGGFQANYNNFTSNPNPGYNDPPTPGSTDSGRGAGRQFGGPVGPGQQYTVGENGPETLQMGAQGGQVIPNNPVDRLGGMNPGMMQALFQLMQQRRPQMNPGQAPIGQPAPQPPQMPQMQPPMGQGPGGMGGQGGGFRLGDWRNRMGIEGLSRPPRQPGMGFGGSGLGMPGIMPQMQQRPGFGG